MKIRVIEPFRDKAFDNKVTRKVGDIIDTEDKSFRCDEELAKERIKGGFAEEVKEAKKETKGKKEKETE